MRATVFTRGENYFQFQFTETVILRESCHVFCSVPQGCQTVCFQTKNPNLGKFWRALDWKMLIYFMDIWNILRTFGIFCVHLVHFSGFGILYQEKSGNPAVPSTEKLSRFNRIVAVHGLV
jgi:hypothetical protein